jgi:RNA polymerase sigma-70 factor (ECF subfamily)
VTDSEQQRHDLFLRLYVEHEESLRGFVRSLVPSLEDSREVMQDVAAVLWRKFEDITSMDDFRRWAFGVARFVAMEFLRTRRRDRHVFGDEALRLLAVASEESEDAFEAERRALNDCLRKLPEDQRKLVEEAYQPGVRMDELAARAGRSAMALYKSLHRIRIALMNCMRVFGDAVPSSLNSSPPKSKRLVSFLAVSTGDKRAVEEMLEMSPMLGVKKVFGITRTRTGF